MFLKLPSVREGVERGRRPLLLAALLTAFFPVLVALPAQADDFDLGLRGGVYTDQSDAFVGAEVLTRIGSTRWFFNPNAEFVFVDRGDLITVNADLHYDLPVDAPVYVWLGGGPALVLRDHPRGRDENDVGLNLLAGVGFLKGHAVRPYVQGKLLLADESEAVLAFGIRF